MSLSIWYWVHTESQIFFTVLYNFECNFFFILNLVPYLHFDLLYVCVFCRYRFVYFLHYNICICFISIHFICTHFCVPFLFYVLKPCFMKTTTALYWHKFLLRFSHKKTLRWTSRVFCVCCVFSSAFIINKVKIQNWLVFY